MNHRLLRLWINHHKEIVFCCIAGFYEWLCSYCNQFHRNQAKIHGFIFHIQDMLTLWNFNVNWIDTCVFGKFFRAAMFCKIITICPNMPSSLVIHVMCIYGRFKLKYLIKKIITFVMQSSLAIAICDTLCLWGLLFSKTSIGFKAWISNYIHVKHLM